MNIKKISAFLVSLAILSIFGVGMVFAQGEGGSGPSSGEGGSGPSIRFNLENPFGANRSLFGVFTAIIDNIILPIGGVLAVLAFIYSGFLYVVAQGNEEKIKAAHRSLLYTSIGTAVLLGAWVIANVICRTIGELGGPTSCDF